MQFDINFARKLARKINADPTINIEIDPETATEKELKSLFFSFVKDKIKKDLVHRIMQSAKTTYNTPLPEQAQAFIQQGIVAMYANRSDESHIPAENRFYYQNMLSNVDKLAALFVINKKLSQEGRKDELRRMKFKFIKSFIDLEQIIDTYLPSYTVRYLDRWNNTMEAVRKYIKKGDIELVYHNKPEMEDSDAVLVRLLPQISYQGIKEMLTETNTNKSTTVCIAQNDSYWNSYKRDYVFILFIHPRNDFYHKIKVSTLTGTIEISGVIAHVITYKTTGTGIREYKNQFNQDLKTLSLPLSIIKEINFKIAEIIGLSDTSEKKLEELYTALDKFMKNVSSEAVLLLQNLVSNIYIHKPSQTLEEKDVENIIKLIAQRVITKAVGSTIDSKEIEEGLKDVGKAINIWMETDFQGNMPGYDFWNQLKDEIKNQISTFIRNSQLEVISDIISPETFRIMEANYEEDESLVKNVKIQFIPPNSSSPLNLVGDFDLQNELVYKTLRDKFISANRKEAENHLKFFVDHKYEGLLKPDNNKVKKNLFDIFSTFLASSIMEYKVRQYDSKKEEILNQVIPKLRDEIIKSLFGPPTKNSADASRENVLKYKDLIMDVNKINTIVDTYKSLLEFRKEANNTYSVFIPSVVLRLTDPHNIFSSNKSEIIVNMWETVITVYNDEEILKNITDKSMRTLPQNTSLLDEIKNVIIQNIMEKDNRYYKMMLNILMNALFSSKRCVERFVNAILTQIYDTSYFVVNMDYIDYVSRKGKAEDDTDLDIDIDIFEF